MWKLIFVSLLSLITSALAQEKRPALASVVDVDVKYILISTLDTGFSDAKKNYIIPENRGGVVSKIASKLLKSKPEKCDIFTWSVYPVALLDSHKNPLAGYLYYPMARPGPVFIRMNISISKGVITLSPIDSSDFQGIVFDDFDSLIKPWVELQ